MEEWKSEEKSQEIKPKFLQKKNGGEIYLDRQVNKSVRSMVISNYGGRKVWISLIVAEVPHSILAVNLIFNL